MDGSEIDVGKTNADEGYRWANTFLHTIFHDLCVIWSLFAICIC